MARRPSAAFLAAGRPYRTLAKEFPRGTTMARRMDGARELKRYLADGMAEGAAIDRVLGRSGRTRRNPARGREYRENPRLNPLVIAAAAIGGLWLWNKAKGG